MSKYKDRVQQKKQQDKDAIFRTFDNLDRKYSVREGSKKKYEIYDTARIPWTPLF